MLRIEKKSINNFIATTGITAISTTWHKNGAVTIIVGNDAYVAEQFSN